MLSPQIDPTPIFELFRSNYATELLTAAVAHFNIFGRLAAGPLPQEALREQLGLAERPAVVLFCALRAMKLLETDSAGQLQLSSVAREHLVPGGPLDVGDYVRLTADSPGVQQMIERLVTNRAKGAEHEDGAAWTFRAGTESAMEKEATARHFTLGLAGRAKNVAPLLAERVPLGEARLLVDVAGGTGIYSIACLHRHPRLRAIVWDRPEVLKVAAEMAAEYGVADRLELRPGDMFTDPVPAGADLILLSNVLHDWDVPECETLVRRCADALAPGKRLLVHDVYLNDALDGPLAIALYSAALFCVTEGRAYSAAEVRGWLNAAGLRPSGIVPTLVHCGVMTGTKK